MGTMKMRAAREAIFPGVPWQRCQFHLTRNAMAFVPEHGVRNLNPERDPSARRESAVQQGSK